LDPCELKKTFFKGLCLQHSVFICNNFLATKQMLRFANFSLTNYGGELIIKIKPSARETKIQKQEITSKNAFSSRATWSPVFQTSKEIKFQSFKKFKRTHLLRL
jgi:hypothetical protein